MNIRKVLDVILVRGNAVNLALFFFSIFINDLIEHLRASNINGIQVSNGVEDILTLLYADDIANVRPSSVPLTFYLLEQMFQMGTATCHEEQLCQIILEFMHECRRYSSDKLNLLPFYHLTVKCDINL